MAVCPVCGSEDISGGFCLSCGTLLSSDDLQTTAPRQTVYEPQAVSSAAAEPFAPDPAAYSPAAPSPAAVPTSVPSPAAAPVAYPATAAPTAGSATSTSAYAPGVGFDATSPAAAAPTGYPVAAPAGYPTAAPNMSQATPAQPSGTQGLNWRIISLVLAACVVALIAVLVLPSISGNSALKLPTSGDAATDDTAQADATNGNDATDENSNDSQTEAPSQDDTVEQSETPAQEPAPVVEQEEPAPAAPPRFTYAQCSSYLDSSEFVSTYYPDYVLDGNRQTGWVEGDQSSDGIGEWVAIMADTPQTVSGVSIINGYSKGGNDTLYYENNRCASVTVQLSDGYQATFGLADVYNTWQDLDFGGTHQTTYIRVIIDSVYHGSRWNDTVIDELSAY